MSVVCTENLSRRFGARWAYARIDCTLQPEEKLLLIGANGSGKTTFLRTIATLLPPTLGNMQLFGLNPHKDVEKIRSQIGFLSYKTGMYEDLSLVENLQFFARLYNKTVSITDIHRYIQQVGLDLRPEGIKTYSAGMRQRATIALLLLKEPKLLLLDEPFSALDPKGVEDISRLLAGMPASQIIVSHQIEEASKICDKAMLFENGLLRWQGEAHKAVLAWKASQQEAV